METSCVPVSIPPRIIADLDELTGYPPIGAESRAKGKNAEARRAHHRRRLAEPDPPPKRMTVQEERAALWDALGRSASQAKEVSPAGGWIGIRLSPARDGLGKGPFGETKRCVLDHGGPGPLQRDVRPALLVLCVPERRRQSLRRVSCAPHFVVGEDRENKRLRFEETSQVAQGQTELQ